MAELASAYVTIIPSLKGASKSIQGAISGVDTNAAGSKLGAGASEGFAGGFASIKGVCTAIAASAAVASVAAFGKSALDSFASYEQLVGGVDTLFKDSSGKLQQYAAAAYKTAGVSANQYMEQATSFSATLLQGLKGDTGKAVEAANMAIVDMSDNANKMGTDLGMLQNAYQGFAKDNFTMLDNLKLGYGGTAAEMARLVNESGVMGKSMKVTAESVKDVPFDKMIEAIHKVQEDMDITGTTAKEASDTVEGSVGSMKAAWANWVTELGKDNADMDKLTSQLVDTVIAAAGNVIPRIGQIVSSIGTALTNAAPDALKRLGPALAGSISEAVGKISEAGPMLAGAASSLMEKLGGFLSENLPSVLDKGLEIAEGLSSSLRESAGTLFDSACELMLKFAKGVADSIPSIIQHVPTIVSNIAGIINDNAPKLLVTAVKIIWTLAKGLVSAIPTIVANIPKIIMAIVDVFLAFNWISFGKSLITGLANGVKSMTASVKTAGKNVLDALKNAITKLPSTLANLGRNAVSKLANGVSSLAGNAGAAALRVAARIKSAITSLPGQMIKFGKNVVTGLANGIKGAIGSITGAVSNIPSKIKGFFSNAGSWLKNAGKLIITGLIDGITGSLGGLGSALGNVGQFIADHKGPKSYDLKLLTPHGGWIMQSLMTGIENSLPALGSTLGTVSDAVSGWSADLEPYGEVNASVGHGAKAGVSADGKAGDTYNVYLNNNRVNDDDEIKAAFTNMLRVMKRKGAM